MNQVQMKYKDREPVLVHPSQIETMKNRGYEPVKPEASKTKSTTKVK